MGRRTLSLLIYGANGYTGRLIARAACAAGLAPILAGRNAAAVATLAQELGCRQRVFSLASSGDVAHNLSGVDVVLHCAGPFTLTARPMLEACLQTRTHYLDITGEIDVIEQAAGGDGRARQAGVTIMPAVGFDVVPSDCLAQRLAVQRPQARQLELAFWGDWPWSPGTLKTTLLHAGAGGRIRRTGRITGVPLGHRELRIPFPGGVRTAVCIPWGDIASAYYSTGIPNIEVYAALPAVMRGLLPVGRRAARWAQSARVGALAAKAISWLVRGPSPRQRHRGRSEFWGRVTDASGGCTWTTLLTPDGYSLTAATAVQIATEVLSGRVAAGFHTPAMAFGADFIEQFPGVRFGRLEDQEEAPKTGGLLPPADHPGDQGGG